MCGAVVSKRHSLEEKFVDETERKRKSEAKRESRKKLCQAERA